jgi:signal transduction histidine kinase/PAS domain-containing protein
MTGDSLPVALIGILMALWLVGATVAIWVGLSLRRRSLTMLRQTSRLARLLETAPAIPVVVKSDGRIQAADRFSRLLGLGRPAATLSDIADTADAGLSVSDLATLSEHVRQTQRTGKDFVMPVAISGSDRRLLVVGGIADALIYPNGAALLWFFDATESLRELEQRKGESEDARAAFEALAGLIEAAPLPMWHRGPDLKLNFVNRAYVDAVNATDGAHVVADGIELIEPLDGTTADEFAAKAQAACVQSERVVSITLDGERRQLRVFDIPLGSIGVAGLAIDVQDLSDARSESRRLSEAQRDLLNMMSAGVAQFDAHHHLTFANLPFQQLFAFRDQWLAEEPDFNRVLHRMRENGKLPEVRDFPEWRADRESWFRSAEPAEENWLLPDGTHLRVLAQPVPDGGLLLIFEDRTEQAQLASARDILLRVRTATFDNLFEAIAVFSADGRLSIWNRLFAEIWGLSDDILINHPRVDELLPSMAGHLKKPSQMSLIGEMIRMTTANREQRQSKTGFTDGRIFQIATIPLPDGNALFTMLDMSDSMKIEQALRDRNSALSEADAIKGKFLANMSYEFRTPLTSIGGFADLLKAGVAGPLGDQAREYVEAIATSAERLSEQINTVLDYSQIEAGALPIERQWVEIEPLMTEIAEAKAALAKEVGVSVEVRLGEGEGQVMADRKRLGQAIGQIVDNAVRYNRKDGTVLMFARWHADRAEVIISDNGPGLDAEERAAIFDVAARSRRSGGSVTQGLGLLLARQLIESHGGTLAMESEKGGGTTVVISVPREP